MHAIACDYETLGYNKGEIIAIVKMETKIAETNALLPLTSKREEMDALLLRCFIEGLG